jgi:uncharacterized protein
MITIKDSGTASVLFGKTRRAVLSLLYGHVEETFFLREIARITGTGLGPLQRELKHLTEAGLITKTTRGRQTYYGVNSNSPIFSEIKGLVTKTMGVRDVIREALSPLSNRIVFAFVYGSVAKGEERPDSDIDLMVVGNVTFGEIVACLQNAQETLRREINPSVFPLPEFHDGLKNGNYFLQNVMNGPKIFLIGDNDDPDSLAVEQVGGAAPDQPGRD